jgi:DNA-binding SARP family transcriptional activator/class 3 adenylate cyclase/tetratricopeptide (TPR) repeat protein
MPAKRLQPVAASPVEFRLLGALEVDDDGREVALGPKQQSLLAILLLRRGEVVPADQLIDDLYGGRPPRSAVRSLHAHVSRLRKALGDGRLHTIHGGYVLEVEVESLDLDRMEDLVQRGRQALSAGDAAVASSTLAEALRLWRGAPLAEFRYADWAQPEIARLEEQRLAILEDRIEAELALGHHGGLVGELEALVHEHPLRERLRGQLMVTLYRSGRQAEALDVYQDARRALVDELGIEPGRSLRELEQAVLRQDPGLDLPTEEPPEPAAPPGPPALEPPAEPAARELRKTVTVVHVELAATASVPGASLDPEALRRVTGRVFGDVQTSVDRHGGTVEAVTGDAVTAVFGLPAVHEDDALRALRATAEIAERLANLASELENNPSVRFEFRIGVSTGEIVTGRELGLQLRATGEPFHLSAQLAQAASVGDALLDQRTLRLVRDAAFVEDSEVGSTPGFRLLRVEAVAPRYASRLESPMVGRDRERRRLHDAYEQAVADRSCQLFTVLGAAGVGKSRLVREFLSDLDDDVVSARGRCLPYGEGITYWPVLEAVMDVAGIDDTESPVHARRRLAELLEGEEDADRTALRMTDVLGLSGADAGVEESFPVIRRFFEAVAARRSLVVVFDDIHWGEAMFLDLVEHVADWSRSAPILLLCMARPELLDVRPSWGGGKLNSTSVLLEPLSSSECTQLVANLVGEAELAEEVGARVAEASEGNPLFVEEMFSMLIDDGYLVQADGRWTAAGDLTTVPVPPTIHALLAARLDRLTGEERAVVERAAVEGKLFHNGSVKALTSALLAPAVDTHLGSLVRKELIRPDKPFFSGEDAYRFRHLLIRDAAYESIPKEIRADLHELHAEWLAAKTTSVEYDEIIGYHLEQAFRYRAELGPIDDLTHSLGRRAAERLGTAGRRAFVRSDPHAGENLISRSVALLPPGDPFRVELVPNLRVIQGLRDVSWADRVLTEAVEAAATTGDRSLAAHALVQRGLLRLFTGSEVAPAELFAVADRAIAIFEDLGDELGLARAWRLVAQTHYLDRRAASSVEASERALTYARRARDRFEEREIVRYLVVALLLGPAPAREAFTRCDELLAEKWDDLLLPAEVSGAAAALLAMQGRAAEADELIAAARKAIEDAGESIWVISQWYSYVILHGDETSAEAELRPAYQALGRFGETSHFSTIAHALANAVYLQGRYEEAEQLAEECERASGPNDIHSQILWRSTRAKIFARRHAFDEAERLACEAVEFAETTDFLLAHAAALTDLAEVLELSGHPEGAAHALEQAIELSERKGNVLAADNCRARLADLR